MRINKTVHTLLTREQEVELSKKIELGDRYARDKMINSNLRLATSIAKKYSNKGVDFEDLIQESTLGLMKAVDRFDWRKGYKFSTYAYWWILQTVQQYVSSNKGPIAIPVNGNARLYRANVMSKEFEDEFGSPPSEDELADLLGTTADTLQSLRKSASFSVSLDDTMRQSGTEDKKTYLDTLHDNRPLSDELLEAAETKKIVNEALSTLTHREQTVLRLRFGIDPQ